MPSSLCELRFYLAATLRRTGHALSSPEGPRAAAAALLSGYRRTHRLTRPEVAEPLSLMRMRFCVSSRLAAKQTAGNSRSAAV